MKPIDSSFASLNGLTVLPDYAAFLLREKLDEYCLQQITISKTLDIPLLKFFAALTEEEQLAFTQRSVTGYLSHLAENRANDYITTNINLWRDNHLQVVDRDEIMAEDITLINYLRKKVLLHFIPEYTREAGQILELVQEIDFFLTQYQTIATNTLIELLKQRVEEHSHFIQKVTETIPGAIHVFSNRDFKGIYSNNKLPAVIGYPQEELNKLGTHAINTLIHPDDQQVLIQHREDMHTAADDETIVYKYRVKDKEGNYKWLAGYEAVFKRAEDGSVTETIGITLDITNEQKMTSENQTLIKSLSRTQTLYKKAEEIANMGNWVWYIKKDRLVWTDQLYRIYGLKPQSERMTMELFLSFIHPADMDNVKRAIEEVVHENKMDFTFRIIARDGTVKWLRSIANVIKDKEGRASTVVGIEQDVTERQKLVTRLEESQRLYKQAQELARMGNFSWNVQNGDVFWSDEVYRIYERNVGEKVSFEDAFTPILPEHREAVQQAIQQVLESKKGTSVSYAIRLKKGNLRYLLLHTDVQLDSQGKVHMVIGTAQDITDKELLIERLQQSEQLYKQAQALAHIGNWTFDLENENVTWSEEMFRIYSREGSNPLTKEQWFAYLDDETRLRLEKQFELAISGKVPFDMIHNVRLPSGHTKVLHRRGEVIYNNDGKAVRIIGTSQDITEQFQVQTELKESQTFIRKITDATPSVIATYNVNTGKYTFISEGIKKLLGYPAADVLEKGAPFFTGIIHPQDLGGVIEKNQKALAQANADGPKTDLVVEFTYRVKHQNGDYRWLHTYGTVFDYNAAGKVEHVLNISLDVTEQMKATEKIKEQEYFIQQIADASPTILYLFDVATQRIAYINREAFFVLGYLPDEIMEEGAGITDYLYHPEDVTLLPCRRQSQKVFQQVDSMIQYECRMRHKDGEYRWLLVREIVFKAGDDGQVTQIIGAALDINRRKEMERTILQNTLQLEQSNASLEEFAYVASHDLKEPLRKISTFGDRLVASQIDRLSDDGKVYLQKIVDASQRMQNMISDLLSISMISGNRSFESYSLQKVMEEVVQTLEFKIESQKAIIRFDNLPVAKIIPSQFRQLFQNLLANSLKFVREGVQPVITVQCTEADAYEVAPYQLPRAEKYIKLLFTDNGIGFENDYAQKIFAIFQRLHGRSEYEGSGIGLSICKKIVEHHKGVIFAQGKPGYGATFTIILPA